MRRIPKLSREKIMAATHVDGLSVVLLLARDAGRASAFYRDVLGMPLQAEEHDGRPTHYACRLGALYFTIQWATDLAPEIPEGGYDFLQLCFTTADLDGFVERLRELKIAPLHPPQVFEHTRFVTLLDPDGRHVRIMTPWKR
jgi:catechol 2,3-dioxygenase-like lactoylglutathione lyase family enzyme